MALSKPCILPYIKYVARNTPVGRAGSDFGRSGWCWQDREFRSERTKPSSCRMNGKRFAQTGKIDATNSTMPKLLEAALIIVTVASTAFGYPANEVKPKDIWFGATNNGEYQSIGSLRPVPIGE
ncbi:hypothetical protein PG996_005748 [Apiospora saccharicola]|uniref:Uncharacterized protein n=1 Tax=Apiospora saccharicola TaxID=335842 RepID=A0ABR1VMC0_9PEZI